ncbi:hypothetical protein M5K25_008834 [Dendrobium thyrsiflorum]|uniref:Retrotransposon gag domain-containing protein n=1 Tax=Dendrobium thyrsiflorum TaxID=117978 RepID=A0ABD0VGI0_DENTH
MSGDLVSRGHPYPIEYEREPYPAGVTFEWYAVLPNDLVYSFAEQEQLFIQRFISTYHRVTVSELVVTRQRPHESLPNYIVRWRNLSLQCEHQLQEHHAIEILLKNIDGPITPYLKGFSIKTFQKLLTKDSILAAVPPKVKSQPLRRPQQQEFLGAPPPPRKADVHNTFEPQDKGMRPMVSLVPQRTPPPRPQFPPRPQLPPRHQHNFQVSFSHDHLFSSLDPLLELQKSNIIYRRSLTRNIPLKGKPRGKVAQIVQMVTDSDQCDSQCGGQSSDSGAPLSSGEEWQLALSRKTRGMIKQAVQSSETVERRPTQAKSTVTSTFTLPVSSSPSFVVVPTEHISSTCIKNMYEIEKFIITSEGKTGYLPALTLKDFILPPIDDKLMEEDDSGYFWSLSVSSSSRSRTRSFYVLSISDDDIISLHEEEFECDEPVFIIPEGSCYMDSGDESEGTPQPLLVEATQAMTLEPNESSDEFNSFAVGHDVPPSRGRGCHGRGWGRDSARPARNFDSQIAPLPVCRHLIPKGDLVIDDGSDDDADVGHQDISLQSFPYPRYGMRVEGSSRHPSPVPPTTSVHGPLYSDSPSMHELHTLYVPPRPSWHASLFHSVGVPQSFDALGFMESTVDDEIMHVPRYFSPFMDGCVERDSAMAFSGPSVTFCFGSDSRVTLPESLLSSLPAGGITFGSFTDSAYVTFGRPTPSEAAAFSPPQRRGRAAMRPFGRPVARQPARAAARPAPVVRAQPVRPVARQPVPRPLPVQPVRPVARRPAPIVPVVRPAPAPQRRQPVVPLAVIPVEATRARVSPPPSSSRKRGAQAELPSPSSCWVSVFARLSHPETARQTPVTSIVAPVPPVQSVGLDVASSSTSDLGRRARRNRNRRLRLAASEAAVQEMVVSVAQQEPVQRRVVPSQREPRRPTVVYTPDVVVAPEVDAVQGGRFSPLVHSGDEEDAGRIAAAPPVTTTLPRARVPRDGAARALTQRIRSIVRSARSRGRVSEERLLREISQVHFQLHRQSVRQSYQWRRGQPPRQSTRPVVTARPLTDAPSVGRHPRHHGRRPPSEPVRSQLGSVVVVPPPQSDAPSTSRRSRWVWRRRQVDQPVETEQTVGTVRRVDTVVPLVPAAVPMICDRAADDVESVPLVSPPIRVELAGVSDQHGASSPMGPHIDALCQTFSEDDWLGEESEEDVPVHRVCVVTRRGTSDEHRDIEDDMEEQGEADVPSTSAQGGPPRSVDTDATVLQLQAQMAEMARAMATMTAQLTALGVAPQVMEVGTPTTSRDEPVVPPVVVPDPVRVERVQRTVPAVHPTVTFSTPFQT